MPITLSDLMQDDALQLRTRRDLRRVYDAAKAAVAEGRLELEGHSLPASFNAWIARVEGPDKLPKTDVDVVDFSFKDDSSLRAFAASLRPTPPKPKRVLSLPAFELLESLRALEGANAASLAQTNGKKDDLLAALSDLQGAVYSFLDAYDGVQGALKLPERALQPDEVTVREARSNVTVREARVKPNAKTS